MDSKNEIIENLHDEIIGHFSIRKGQLRGLLFRLAQLAEAQGEQPNLCVWPIRSSDEQESRKEMGIFNAHKDHPLNTGIHFDGAGDTDPTAICRKINDRLLGVDLNGVARIKRLAGDLKTNSEKKAERLALTKLLSYMAPEQLLSTPGAYKPLARQYGPHAQDMIKAYKTDPSINNLEIKYTTAEIIEILLSSLEDMNQLVEDIDEEGLPREKSVKIEQARQSAKLGRGFLSNMKTLLENMTI